MKKMKKMKKANRAITTLINCLLQNNKRMTRITHKVMKKWNMNSFNMRNHRI